MADDVVETLLESHAFARSTLALAERLCSAPSSESTRAVAEQVATFFGQQLLLHFADEESTLAPRLARRHKVLDETLAAMTLEHEQLRALLSRVVFLCRLVAGDASRLLALRFELSAAVEHLRGGLLAHQAKEESLLFPAVRRLLDWRDVEEMHAEMALRRAPGIELTEA